MQVTAAPATFFFEFLQELRSGSRAGPKAAQQSGEGTEGQRGAGTQAKGQPRQRGPGVSSPQAAAGAEGQRDLCR